MEWYFNDILGAAAVDPHVQHSRYVYVPLMDADSHLLPVHFVTGTEVNSREYRDDNFYIYKKSSSNSKKMIFFINIFFIFSSKNPVVNKNFKFLFC